MKEPALRVQNASDDWVVHKFGGTSLGSVAGYQRAVQIVRGDTSRKKAIVVSAMSGVTNRLIELLQLAKQRDDSYLRGLEELEKKHFDTLISLTNEKWAAEFHARLKSDLNDIHDILKGVRISQTYPAATVDIVSGFGEVWSAQIFSTYLKSLSVTNEWIDARQVLTILPHEAGPVVDWDDSRKRLDQRMSGTRLPDFLVITGYVGSTREGVATTLGRNGSDFSASIFAKLLRARWITIWTDVDGVLSADPRRVPEAFVLDSLSYNEATELAFFGAKVLHPKTIFPAIEEKIPVSIRNTFKPEHPGTVIRFENDPGAKNFPVKGFATIENVALLNLEGTGMLGVPGVASRLFAGLKDVGVSVIMISQASSEQSICFVIPGQQGELAKQTVEKIFFAEFHHRHMQRVDLTVPCAVLAAVGDAMVSEKGVAARFFTSLAKAGVNIRAIAQGSSERNISLVIDQNESTRALRAAHAGFYLSSQTLSVGLIGTGLIGATLLKQISAQLERLKSEHHVDVRVRGIMNSKKMLLNDSSIDLVQWRENLAAGDGASIEKFAEFVKSDYLPHAVIIDCTASEEVASRYAGWLKRGIHVITPNKKANSGVDDHYRELRRLSRNHRAHYLYETTVGAALPVISTLRDLVQTGDRIIRIEGILSGTLSYIFNALQPGVAFSKAVLEAKQLGYTEPDPRDDLSGTDFARKLVILAREMGLKLELDQVDVESLVPASLKDETAERFLERLSEFDGAIDARWRAAASSGGILRYVGTVELSSGKANVGLKNFGADHPFARLAGTDNVIAFTTERYSKNPLLVQGPGAGPEVTAGGVFADLLRLAAYVGAPS